MERRFTVDNAGLAECQAFVSSHCESPRPQVIMDEIVSNIVRCSGASFFSVDFRFEPEGLVTIVFTDDGVAFDPTAAESPDVSAPSSARTIGGLGIFIVRKMSKSVTYARRNGCNVLTVVMPL